MGFLGILRCQSLIFGEFHVKWWFFVKFPWKSWIFMFWRGKVEKGCNRTPGWVSRKAAKVVCFIRVWGGYLGPGVEFSWITPFCWKFVEFNNIPWKWSDFTLFSAPWGGNGARAAPGWKHQRNPCFSYAFEGSRAPKSAFRGGFSPKTQFRVLFWWNH